MGPTWSDQVVHPKSSASFRSDIVFPTADLFPRFERQKPRSSLPEVSFFSTTEESSAFDAHDEASTMLCHMEDFLQTDHMQHAPSPAEWTWTGREPPNDDGAEKLESLGSGDGLVSWRIGFSRKTIGKP